MRPRTWMGWTSAALVVLVTAVLMALFFLAFFRAVALVDAVPGADAGLASSPALDAARGQSALLGVLLLLLGAGTGVVLLVSRRRRQHARPSKGGPPAR